MLSKTLPRLSICNSVLRTYTGEPISVLGKFPVKAHFGDRIQTLPVYVVSGDRPNLLGTGWIRGFPDTLEVVKTFAKVPGLKVLLMQYSVATAVGLRQVKDFQ
ncbi:unnamed protein product, partial [Dicrocoelium dendriticum]